MQKNWAICILAISLIIPLAHAEEPKTTGTAVTIYSSAGVGAVSPEMYRPVAGQGVSWFGTSVPGYATIRDRRKIRLPSANNNISFTDVAALIDPTTVSFRSLTDAPGTSVLEQNYLFDLVSPQKLLERYLGKNIIVEQNAGDKIESYEGKLLTAQNGITLEKSNGEVLFLNSYSNVRFAEKLPDLYTIPTLAWAILAKKPGEHLVETSYETKGIAWWADYNLTYSEEEGDANAGTVSLGAWVSILNQSGAGYKDAKLKLVAGDVNRQQPEVQMHVARGMAKMEMMADAAAPQFQQKQLFEYHMYTLGRPTTIPDNSTKQIELLPLATNIKAEKELVYEPFMASYMGYNQMDRGYGNGGDRSVKVFLTFINAEKNHLGMPLPAGRVRVSKRDEADDSLEFIGEDSIKHTPKDDRVRLKLGNAFDVKGDRKQTEFTVDTNRQEITESFEIKVKNSKDKPVNVTVVEHLYRTASWQITEHKGDYKKKDAFTIEYAVKVPANGTETIRYTVKYTW